MPIANMNLSQRPRILWGGGDTYHNSAKEVFRLGHVWCIHYYKYTAKMEYNGRDIDVEPCHFGVCEPYSLIRYHSLDSDENCHFCINFQLQDITESQSWSIPLMTPRDARAVNGLFERFSHAISLLEHAPLDAEVELWSILLTLAKRASAVGLDRVDSVDRKRIREACSLIEVGLTGALYAQDIASALEISVTHLGRLFKRHLDCPVATYIRRRRIRRAHELLCYSELPIQDVATKVGVSDLANFNRMLKREFKLSPRQIRERKSGLRISGLT